MTTAQLDHLRAIDAHLAKLLDIAKKRTPGRWFVYRPNSDSPGIEASETSVVIWGSLHDDGGVRTGANDAAFIAACTGNTESGWRATRAAIALCIANLHTDPEFPTHEAGVICDNDGQGCRACGYTKRILLESILAAFPLESLNP